jgi:hypothetical protein
MRTAHASAPLKSTLTERLAFPVVTAYLWVVMTLFGAIVLETVMIYPNVFADPPESLELTMEFLSVIGPGDVFQVSGLACWILGAASLVLTLRVRNARWWIALGLAALVAEGVVSMLFFWPRNDIMFSEGLAVHSAEYLRQVAQEFETWHWLSRMLFNTIAAVSAFVGFLGLHKRRVLSATVSA